jgi:hypothetical protein
MSSPHLLELEFLDKSLIKGDCDESSSRSRADVYFEKLDLDLFLLGFPFMPLLSLSFVGNKNLTLVFLPKSKAPVFLVPGLFTREKEDI